jgi:hypothetical protein
MSVASKSHIDDAKGGHSRESQTPAPAHQYAGERTSTNCDEALGGVPLRRPQPGHSGPGTPSKSDETLKGAFKREQVRDAKVVPGATQRALKAGPHGKVIHADGSKQSDGK